jgi:hypothetical protein
VKLSAPEVLDVPPGVTTVISTAPADPAGEVAVIEVAEFTVNEVALVVPNLTAETEVKPVPVMLTLVPPAVGPAFGLTAVTVGAAWYVKWSAEVAVEVPLEVVTVTSTVPADPAGELAVIEVAEFTVNEVASVVPNLTAVAASKFVPVMVTLVPPEDAPTVGLTAVTVGAF